MDTYKTYQIMGETGILDTIIKYFKNEKFREELIRYYTEWPIDMLNSMDSDVREKLNDLSKSDDNFEKEFVEDCYNIEMQRIFTKELLHLLEPIANDDNYDLNVVALVNSLILNSETLSKIFNTCNIDLNTALKADANQIKEILTIIGASYTTLITRIMQLKNLDKSELVKTILEGRDLLKDEDIIMDLFYPRLKELFQKNEEQVA